MPHYHPNICDTTWTISQQRLDAAGPTHPARAHDRRSDGTRARLVNRGTLPQDGNAQRSRGGKNHQRRRRGAKRMPPFAIDAPMSKRNATKNTVQDSKTRPAIPPTTIAPLVNALLSFCRAGIERSTSVTGWGGTYLSQATSDTAHGKDTKGNSWRRAPGRNCQPQLLATRSRRSVCCG